MNLDPNKLLFQPLNAANSTSGADDLLMSSSSKNKHKSNRQRHFQNNQYITKSSKNPNNSFNPFNADMTQQTISDASYAGINKYPYDLLGESTAGLYKTAKPQSIQLNELLYTPNSKNTWQNMYNQQSLQQPTTLPIYQRSMNGGTNPNNPSGMTSMSNLATMSSMGNISNNMSNLSNLSNMSNMSNMSSMSNMSNIGMSNMANNISNLNNMTNMTNLTNMSSVTNRNNQNNSNSNSNNNPNEMNGTMNASSTASSGEIVDESHIDHRMTDRLYGVAALPSSLPKLPRNPTLNQVRAVTQSLNDQVNSISSLIGHKRSFSSIGGSDHASDGPNSKTPRLANTNATTHANNNNGNNNSNSSTHGSNNNNNNNSNNNNNNGGSNNNNVSNNHNGNTNSQSNTSGNNSNGNGSNLNSVSNKTTAQLQSIIFGRKLNNLSQTVNSINNSNSNSNNIRPMMSTSLATLALQQNLQAHNLQQKKIQQLTNSHSNSHTITPKHAITTNNNPGNSSNSNNSNANSNNLSSNKNGNSNNNKTPTASTINNNNANNSSNSNNNVSASNITLINSAKSKSGSATNINSSNNSNGNTNNNNNSGNNSTTNKDHRMSGTKSNKSAKINKASAKNSNKNSAKNGIKNSSKNGNGNSDNNNNTNEGNNGNNNNSTNTNNNSGNNNNSSLVMPKLEFGDSNQNSIEVVSNPNSVKQDKKDKKEHRKDKKITSEKSSSNKSKSKSKTKSKANNSNIGGTTTAVNGSAATVYVLQQNGQQKNSSQYQQLKAISFHYPFALWTTAKVQQWLNSFVVGMRYCEQFEKVQVTGQMLLGMNDNYLANVIGITDALHRREILQRIATMTQYTAYHRYLFQCFYCNDFFSCKDDLVNHIHFAHNIYFVSKQVMQRVNLVENSSNKNRASKEFAIDSSYQLDSTKTKKVATLSVATGTDSNTVKPEAANIGVGTDSLFPNQFYQPPSDNRSNKKGNNRVKESLTNDSKVRIPVRIESLNKSSNNNNNSNKNEISNRNVNDDYNNNNNNNEGEAIDLSKIDLMPDGKLRHLANRKECPVCHKILSSSNYCRVHCQKMHGIEIFYVSSRVTSNGQSDTPSKKSSNESSETVKDIKEESNNNGNGNSNSNSHRRRPGRPARNSRYRNSNSSGGSSNSGNSSNSSGGNIHGNMRSRSRSNSNHQILDNDSPFLKRLRKSIEDAAAASGVDVKSENKVKSESLNNGDTRVKCDDCGQWLDSDLDLLAHTVIEHTG